MKSRPLAIAALCLLAVTEAVAAPEQPALQGNVVVARLSNSPVLIWDATNVVLDIVHKKMSDADANDVLERDALLAVASKSDVLKDASGTLTLRVIYNKVGALNPAYNAQTLVGIETYALATMPVQEARSDAGARAADQKLPTWVHFSVVGKLPPR